MLTDSEHILESARKVLEVSPNIYIRDIYLCSSGKETSEV